MKEIKTLNLKMMDDTELKHEFINDGQCFVCLSVGRKLFNLGEYIDVFKKITADLEYQNHLPLEEVQICWECYAFLRRLNQFLLKVNKAYELFALGQNYIHGSQSNLTTIILNESYPQTLYLADVVMATDVNSAVKNDGFDDLTDDLNTGDLFIDEIKIEDGKKDENKEMSDPKKPRNNRWAKQRALQNKKPKFKIITEYTKDSFKNIEIDEKELRLYLERERKSEQYISKQFKCETCVIAFENEDLMKQHENMLHDQSKPYPCDICNSRYLKKRHLAVHIRNHYKKYLCTVCDYATCDKSQRQSHYKKHKRVFQCIKCKLKFSCRKEFFQHHKDWHELFICDHCGISFKMRYCIKDHMRKQHSPHKCEPCNRTFTRYNGLWLHNKLTHAAPNPRYCVECDTHYPDRHRYQWHLANSARHRKRRGSRIPCPGCDKIFSKNIYMKDHYNLVHLKNYKYRCEECNKNFIRNADLVKHKRRIHEGIKPPKNKICYVCGKGFSTNKILSNHLRTHTGEKPYSCGICNARFTQRPTLVAHERAIHDNTRTDGQTT